MSKQRKEQLFSTLRHVVSFLGGGLVIWAVASPEEAKELVTLTDTILENLDGIIGGALGIIALVAGWKNKQKLVEP